MYSNDNCVNRNEVKVKWNGGSLVGVVILDKSHCLENVMTLLRQ